MDNHVGAVLGNQRVHKFFIGYTVYYHPKVLMGNKVLSSARCKVVNHKDIIPTSKKHLGNVRTYLTTTACNEYFHP